MVNLEEGELLSSVWEAYGNLDGNQLENLTHSETPWIEARGELRPWEICTKEISEDTMRDFYLKKYQDSQND